mmetsp:Transcript_33138/g.67773  ORF Transcript_33138/g.67773 Transcript_33138/m.67773 type:complete len:267 (+) Transcript_33138:3-803(+)
MGKSLLTYAYSQNRRCGWLDWILRSGFAKQQRAKTAQHLFELEECEGGRDARPHERPGLGHAEDLRVGVGEFHHGDPVGGPRRRQGLGLREALRQAAEVDSCAHHKHPLLLGKHKAFSRWQFCHFVHFIHALGHEVKLHAVSEERCGGDPRRNLVLERVHAQPSEEADPCDEWRLGPSKRFSGRDSQEYGGRPQQACCRMRLVRFDESKRRERQLPGPLGTHGGQSRLVGVEYPVACHVLLREDVACHPRSANDSGSNVGDHVAAT